MCCTAMERKPRGSRRARTRLSNTTFSLRTARWTMRPRFARWGQRNEGPHGKSGRVPDPLRSRLGRDGEVKGGDRYGRYEIVQAIGRGAMGFVYLARDTETGRNVALKIVQMIEAADQDMLEAERLGAELEKRLAAVDTRVVPVNRYGNTGSDL